MRCNDQTGLLPTHSLAPWCAQVDLEALAAGPSAQPGGDEAAAHDEGSAGSE